MGCIVDGRGDGRGAEDEVNALSIRSLVVRALVGLSMDALGYSFRDVILRLLP